MAIAEDEKVDGSGNILSGLLRSHWFNTIGIQTIREPAPPWQECISSIEAMSPAMAAISAFAVLPYHSLVLHWHIFHGLFSIVVD